MHMTPLIHEHILEPLRLWVIYARHHGVVFVDIVRHPREPPPQVGRYCGAVGPQVGVPNIRVRGVGVEV